MRGVEQQPSSHPESEPIALNLLGLGFWGLGCRGLACEPKLELLLKVASPTPDEQALRLVSPNPET